MVLADFSCSVAELMVAWCNPLNVRYAAVESMPVGATQQFQSNMRRNSAEPRVGTVMTIDVYGTVMTVHMH